VTPPCTAARAFIVLYVCAPLLAWAAGRPRGGDMRKNVGTDHDHLAILIATKGRCKIAPTILAKAVSRYG
jgi:hypothetical protein